MARPWREELDKEYETMGKRGFVEYIGKLDKMQTSTGLQGEEKRNWEAVQEMKREMMANGKMGYPGGVAMYAADQEAKFNGEPQIREGFNVSSGVHPGAPARGLETTAPAAGVPSAWAQRVSHAPGYSPGGTN